MTIKKIPIKTESIQLDQFLKWANLVSSGGQAKNLIQEGKVSVNGEVEYNRGRKIYSGDLITMAQDDLKYQVNQVSGD